MAIWLILVLVSVPALLLLGNPEAMRDPVRTVLNALRVEQRRPVPAVWQVEEPAVAWREVAWEAEERADDAWRTWQQAEERVSRARAAAAFAAPESPRTAAEYADRERFLHRTVRGAVERGDLPVAALRAQWDPRLHPVEQELVLLRAVAAHRQRLFRQATADAAVVAARPIPAVTYAVRPVARRALNPFLGYGRMAV
ncbi:hypothetical protein [Actinoplanes ianthinogenes]|nr:hypothetical protein [Actinoplanes ianthinogenes]